MTMKGIKQALLVAGSAEPVGWVERSETHQSLRGGVMGFASLYPSYAARYPNSPFPGT
jgi:hypothetical protein